jgi:hypothetical protein
MGKRGPKPKRGEVAWSPELAYAVGLITTDGSLSKNGRCIDLTSKDCEQLVTFLKCIGRPDISIGIKKNSQGTPITRVQVGDITLYNFLLSIGLMPNKTKKVGPLAIPEKYLFDFLRGHYDGDGSFYSYYDPRWKSSFMFYLSFVSASPAHIAWIREELLHKLKVKGHITTAIGSCVLQLKYGKKETIEILKRLYPNPEVVCLSRKRLKIEHALRIVGKSLPAARKNLAK